MMEKFLGHDWADRLMRLAGVIALVVVAGCIAYAIGTLATLVCDPPTSVLEHTDHYGELRWTAQHAPEDHVCS